MNAGEVFDPRVFFCNGIAARNKSYEYTQSKVREKTKNHARGKYEEENQTCETEEERWMRIEKKSFSELSLFMKIDLNIYIDKTKAIQSLARAFFPVL